jgi:ribonucleoside-diphosphate reductase alpha chain
MEESKTIKSDDNHSGNSGMTVEEWLNGEQLSVDIWHGKYQQGDETFEQWLDRVSGGNQHIRQLIKEQKFIFAGRILSNRGVTDRKITYSNCYCLTPPQDSLESIFEAGSKLARTFSYGGGSGVDVSNLRPKNAPVNNAAKSTSGTVSFMDFYSYITGLIGQEGRRGALMISISCEHPDLVEFINLKADLDICTKANISVRVTNAFMQAVENNSDFKLHFTMEDGSEITRIVNAREVFMLLAKRNWEMAEPGILYWDRISDYNLLQGTGFKYAGVNPCAEEPLPAGGSCLLGSINLSKFVEYPFTDYPIVKYDELAKTVESAICALNDVLIEGLPLHPLQEQRDSVAGWRQIGLGTMGLGDLLLMCGKKYGAPESIPVITKIYHLIASTAIKTSLQLAKDNECFPNCTPEIKKAMVECDFIRNLDLPKEVLDDIKEYGLFNSQLLTCAPTGSIGTMLQVSTGVEPNYAFSYNRRTVSLNKEETVYKVDTKIVADYKKATGNDTLPDYFVSSEQIPYEQRIEVQATLQRFIDASISSTVNLPNSITIEDVANLYLLAWKKGLKGITIWRDGCQRQAILTKENSGSEEQPVLKRGEILKASDDLVGKKRTLQTGCGTLHLSAWFDRNTGELVETFFSKGSTGGCALFMTGLSRMTSLAARAGAPIDAIVDQLLSSGTCPSYAVRNATKKDTSKGSSCPVAIGYALMEMYKDVQTELGKTESEKETTVEAPKCPKCGEPIQMVEGCMTCPSCGYSKCS